MWFKFNNHHSKDDLGIELLEAPKLLLSGKRVEFTDIVGRDGFLSYSDGSYEGFEHTLKCFINKDSNNLDLDEVFMTLQNGAVGDLILCNRPDRYHKAVVSNKISVDQFIANDCYEFPVSFKCQPFSYLLSGKEYTEVTSGMELTNLGKLPSKPRILIKGSGSIVLTIADKSVTLNNINGEVILDTELEECTLNGSDFTYYMEGEFPILPLGAFTISYTGSFDVKIQPNWICL